LRYRVNAASGRKGRGEAVTALGNFVSKFCVNFAAGFDRASPRAGRLPLNTFA
jgi:hypothetical protein